MLLPNHQRVVIEVDGAHHFSRDGKPSPAVYADMVSADRDLRLSGYEIYRFGANELVGDGAPDVILNASSSSTKCSVDREGESATGRCLVLVDRGSTGAEWPAVPLSLYATARRLVVALAAGVAHRSMMAHGPEATFAPGSTCMVWRS